MSHRPSDFKLSNIKRAFVGARMAGVAVERIDVDKDGKISIYPAKEPATAESAQADPSNEWDAPVAKLPLKFVHAVRDRHGKVRHYFRRAGFQSVRLPSVHKRRRFVGLVKDAKSSKTRDGNGGYPGNVSSTGGARRASGTAYSKPYQRLTMATSR